MSLLGKYLGTFPNPTRMARSSHGRSCPKRGTRSLGHGIFHRATLSQSPYHDLIVLFTLSSLFASLTRRCQSTLPSWPIRAARSQKGKTAHSRARVGSTCTVPSNPPRWRGTQGHGSLSLPITTSPLILHDFWSAAWRCDRHLQPAARDQSEVEASLPNTTMCARTTLTAALVWSDGRPGGQSLPKMDRLQMLSSGEEKSRYV